jgi:predicted dienelactone hydrolase
MNHEFVMKKVPTLIAIAILAACSSSQSGTNTSTTAPPPMTIGTYNSDAGPSPVGVIPVATLHDAQRSKDLELSIEYPTRGGPFPVIVFSHGYGSSDRGYEPLISYWTSYGYVCIRPSHADAGTMRDTLREALERRPQQQQRQRRTQPTSGQEQPRERNAMEAIWDREREPQWRDRVLDVKLVLDSLDELERQFPELRGKMDHSRIGVGGHSYGAFTAMLINGARTFSNPPLSLADPRVRAAVVMSPQGTAANRGLTEQSWTEVRIPVMYMTGSLDRGATESETPEWRKQAFEFSPAGDKYFVLIPGASHLSFTGGAGAIAFESTQTSPYGYGQRGNYPQQNPQRPAGFANRGPFNTIKITSLTFWDAYLKNDTGAREVLTPEKLQASGVTLVKK